MSFSRRDLLKQAARSGHGLKKPDEPTMMGMPVVEFSADSGPDSSITFGTSDQYRVIYKVPIRNIYDFEVNKEKRNGIG